MISIFGVPFEPGPRTAAIFPRGPVPVPQHAPVTPPVVSAPPVFAQAQTPAHHRRPHELRAHVPPALEQLQVLHRALTYNFRVLGDVMVRTDFDDRKNTAIDVASAVLQVLGLALPKLTWLPGSHDLRASPQGIAIGESLARSLSVPELVQAILHTAGRAHAGRAEGAAELLFRLFHQLELLDDAEATDLLQNPARTPTLYAALAAWMFAPEMRPDPRVFLGSEAELTARDTALILRALDACG